QTTRHQRRIADVAMHEVKALRGIQPGQRVEVAGIGECVEIDDGPAIGNGGMHAVAADEPGAAGDKKGWHAVVRDRSERDVVVAEIVHRRTRRRGRTLLAGGWRTTLFVSATTRGVEAGPATRLESIISTTR